MSTLKSTTNNLADSIKTNKGSCSQLKRIKIQKTVDESIVMSLLGLTDAINKKGDQQCQRFGITMNQYLIMRHLAGDPNIDYFNTHSTTEPIVASELADALNVSRANVSNLLNLLIEKKLVEKAKGKDDWRKNYLLLTTEGWALLEKMKPCCSRLNHQLLEYLSENDKKTFLQSLQTCLDSLNKNEHG
jgi:DNA-binding MarR family transcriptional regulator